MKRQTPPLLSIPLFAGPKDTVSLGSAVFLEATFLEDIPYSEGIQLWRIARYRDERRQGRQVCIAC